MSLVVKRNSIGYALHTSRCGALVSFSCGCLGSVCELCSDRHLRDLSRRCSWSEQMSMQIQAIGTGAMSHLYLIGGSCINVASASLCGTRCCSVGP